MFNYRKEITSHNYELRTNNENLRFLISDKREGKKKHLQPPPNIFLKYTHTHTNHKLLFGGILLFPVFIKSKIDLPLT